MHTTCRGCPSVQRRSTEWKRQSRERERGRENKNKNKKSSFNHSSRMLQLASWRWRGRDGKAVAKKTKIERGANNKQNKITLKKNGGQQGKRGPEEQRTQRLKRPFVQQFVDAVADLPQRESVLLSVPVQLGQEVAVGEMVEDVVDARVRASR